MESLSLNIHTQHKISPAKNTWLLATAISFFSFGHYHLKKNYLLHLETCLTLEKKLKIHTKFSYIAFIRLSPLYNYKKKKT